MGQNVTAGPYQVLLTFSINYNVCAVGAVGACLTPQTGTATTSILPQHDRHQRLQHHDHAGREF